MLFLYVVDDIINIPLGEGNTFKVTEKIKH